VIESGWAANGTRPIASQMQFHI